MKFKATKVLKSVVSVEVTLSEAQMHELIAQYAKDNILSYSEVNRFYLDDVVMQYASENDLFSEPMVVGTLEKSVKPIEEPVNRQA